MKKYYIGSRKKKKILQTIEGKKDNWICHILHRNSLLKYVNEGKLKRKIEVGERPVSRRKQLLDELEGKR
jgi:hypothetical protein